MAVEKQVNVIISAVDQFSGALTDLGGHFDTIALAAVAIEAAILAASIAAANFAVDIGQDCFDSAVDFHDAIYDVEAVASSFGTTGGEIGDILDNLVNKFPVTGEVGGEALQLIAQMGYGAKDELDKVSDSAMTLSIATGTDLKTAAEATMASMNQFGFEVEDVDRVINLFAATSFTSAATVSDLKEAMKYAGAEAALSGISIEETAAACGILKDKGLEASQAGTTFRMALSQLYKETDAGAESLAKYGLSYEDVNPSVVGLTGVVEAFDGQTLSAEDAMNIFGVRSKSFALLINDGAESFREYVEEISNTEAAYEAAEIKLGQWSVVMDNVEGSMDIFKKTIAADLVPSLIELIGKTADEGIRGVITQLIEMEKVSGEIGQPMTDLFEELKDLADELFEDAFEDAEGFYDWLGSISEALGKNIEVLAIWGAAAIEAFVGATDEGDELKSMLELVNGAITAMMVPVGIIHDLFVGFFYALELGLDSAQYVFYKLGEAVASVSLGITEGLGSLPFVDMETDIENLQEDVKTWGELAEEALNKALNTEPPELWAGKVIEASAKATEAINEFGTDTEKTYGEVEQATVDWSDKITEAGDKYNEAKDKLDMLAEGGPELVGTTEEWTEAVKEANEEYENAETELKKVLTEAENLEETHSKATERVVEWKEKLDLVTEKYEEAKEKAAESADVTEETNAEVSEWAVEVANVTENYEEAKEKAEESKKATESITEEALLWGEELVKIDNATGAVTETTKSTTDAVKETKEALSEVEKFELSLEAETFKSDLKIAEQAAKDASSIIETEIEWTAKINIAEIEAAADVAVAQAETMQTAFDAVSDSISGISSGMGAFTSALTSGELSTLEQWNMMDLLEDQVEMQQKLVDSQIEMNDALIAEGEAKTKAMEEGGAEISVEVQGDTEGWLKGLMESLFDEIMIKAKTESFSVFGTE